jgi:Tfp pilus assembly protein PilF
MRVSIHRQAMLIACMVTTLFLGRAGADSSIPRNADRIDLLCKIVSPSGSEQGSSEWVIKVKSIDGKILRDTKGFEGQTVHFRHMSPGIYSVCIAGAFNRIRCESIDLYPPSGRSSYRFLHDLETPLSVLNQGDFFQISVADLGVPKEAQNEFAESELARQRGDDKSEVRHLETSIEIYPSYGDALNNLGLHYYHVRNLQKAVQLFRKVSEVNPDCYVGWINLSVSLMSLGRPEEALDAVRHAHQLRPREPTVLSQLARIFYSLKNYSEAAKYFHDLERVDPVNPSYPQLYLAQMALNGRDVPKAKQHLKSFLQFHPNIPEAPRYQSVLKTLDNLATESATKVLPIM